MAPVEITRTIDPQSRAKERKTSQTLERGEVLIIPFPTDTDKDTGLKHRTTLGVRCGTQAALLQILEEEGKSRLRVGRWLNLGFKKTGKKTDWDELKKGEPSLKLPIGENEVIEIEMK